MELIFNNLLMDGISLTKKSYENTNGLLYKIVSLIPVKWNYYVENKYLVNSFVAVENSRMIIDISLEPTNTVVKDINGEKLFYSNR